MHQTCQGVCSKRRIHRSKSTTWLGSTENVTKHVKNVYSSRALIGANSIYWSVSTAVIRYSSSRSIRFFE